MQIKGGGSHKEGGLGLGVGLLQEDSGPPAVGAGPPCSGGVPAWWLQTRMPGKEGHMGTNITLPWQWGAPGLGVDGAVWEGLPRISEWAWEAG